jgi:hypothetical protein
MAVPVTRGPLAAARLLASLVATALLVVACGGAAPSSAPSVAPTPVVTPDVHLPDPASAQQVFIGLGRAGLKITPNTATAGPKDGPVVTKIFATYLGWPLDVTEYRSTSALARALAWEAGAPPGRGEHPVALAGSNILVTWGPAVSGKKPARPDVRQAVALRDLVSALDALLAPLQARTIVAVSVSAPIASAPTSPTTTAAPEATPAP